MSSLSCPLRMHDVLSIQVQGCGLFISISAILHQIHQDVANSLIVKTLALYLIYGCCTRTPCYNTGQIIQFPLPLGKTVHIPPTS